MLTVIDRWLDAMDNIVHAVGKKLSVLALSSMLTSNVPFVVFCAVIAWYLGPIARMPLKSPLSYVPLKTWVSTQPFFIARKYCVVKLSLLTWVADLSDRPRNNASDWSASM